MPFSRGATPPNSGFPSTYCPPRSCNMQHPHSRVERSKPGNQSTTMRTISSESSGSASNSLSPARRTCNRAMSLSVSAVSPIRGGISRMSSSESSVGSPSSDSAPRQRTKKRTIQLVFPYIPAIVQQVSSPRIPKPVPLFDLVSKPCVLYHLTSRTSSHPKPNL